MSIEAEIEALITTLVDDLVELVRVAAVQSLEQAFQEVDLGTAPRPRPRRVPSKNGASSRSREPASKAEAPARSSRATHLAAPSVAHHADDEPQVARASEGPSLSVWPKGPEGGSAPASPVVRRFPPKRVRTRRPSTEAAQTEAAPREPTPAKSWIVRRRGASERGGAVEASEEATSEGAGASAIDAKDDAAET